MLALLPADPSPDPLEALLALDALHQGVLEDARRLRAVQVRLARRLLALRRAPSLYRFGATTFALYCETVGLSAGEGRDLASLAEAEMVRPDVVPRFAEGRLSLGKVSALAHLLRLPRREASGPGVTGSGVTGSGVTGSGVTGSGVVEEDWVATAEGVTTRDLWRLLEERREEQRLRESPEFVAMFVSRRGREDFLRCRELVSRREWLPVTEGATLERVCDTFLVRNDPERRAARLADRDRKASAAGPCPSAERAPPPYRFRADSGIEAGTDAGIEAGTEDRLRRRRIPAALQRGLIRLFGDRCWIQGCDRRSFLEFAHRVPVRLGGGEDPDNLLRLCREHHGQFDGEGWRLIPRRDGVVVLVDRRGVVVGMLRRAPGPAPGEAVE